MNGKHYKGEKSIHANSNVIRSCCTIVLFVILAGISTLPAMDFSSFQGERLKFTLIYKGIKSATSYMWLEPNDATTTIIWTVKSKPLFRFLFKINNRYEAIVDNNGTLLQAKKAVDQKNIQQTWTIDYDWQKDRAKTNQNYDWPLVEDCQNILSMLYHLRSRPLSIGDSIKYVLDVESQIWQISGIVKPVHTKSGNVLHEIVFRFKPAMEIKGRAWPTDLLTHRLARNNSNLIIRLDADRRPMLLKFGSADGTVEMRLK